MIAYLNHWSGDGPAALRGQVRLLPHGAPLALDGVRAVLVPAHADQRGLLARRDTLQAFLFEGGTLVFNGHVAYPLLPWLSPFEPAAPAGLDGLRIHRAAEHPVFDGVLAEDLTFRRGVAGFYARGSNPPPPQAQVLNTIGPQRLPVDWLLTLPGGGRLLMHSGNDLWMYAGGQDSAARIVPQLLHWLQGESA